MIQELLRRRALIRFHARALHHNAPKQLILHPAKISRTLTSKDLLVHLSWSFTFTPGLLPANHLQQHHAKGIDVHRSVVIFIINLRRDEVHRPHNRSSNCTGLLQRCGEPKIANHDLSTIAVDEDVIALQVPVDDGIRTSMQIIQAFQDLSTPVANHLQFQRRVDALDVLEKGASRDPLRYKADLLLLLVRPSINEGNDLGMLQRF
mmetsp:Transcript_18178/g.42550  ORF Transcript_18178/g.42550 Transcript_18178/m.42550 type:complete len:206 (-) Transcript_18178:669-1286(-)